MARAVIRRILLGVVGLALAASGAPAQVPESGPVVVTAESSSDEPVPPIVGQRMLNFTVTYPCNEVWLAAPEPLSFILAAEPADAWTIADIQPPQYAVVLDPGKPAACPPGETGSFVASLVVRFTREAPAFRVADINLNVTMSSRQGERQHGEAGVQFRVGFYSVLSAAAHEAVVSMPGGGTRAFAIQLDNHGNGAIIVNISLARPAPDGLRIELPPEVSLGSRMQGAEETSATVQLKAVDVGAGRFLEHEDTRLDVVIQSRSAEVLGVAGDSAQLAFLLRVEAGVVEKAPAPGLAWLGLALVVLLLRRR